jgi:ADP-ribose pyrophosphatase YjhB (NUDIX family)
MANSKWLAWAQALQAHAQNGLTYTTNPFDAERFERIRDIAAEMMAAGTESDPPILHDLFDRQSGYMTPKLDIRGVIYRDDKILLVNELADGKWTLPGGWVDINESPSEAVEREVYEETGYLVKAKRLLALYDRNKHGHPNFIFHLYKVFIQCELTGGSPSASLETGASAFYADHDYPPLSIARTTPEVLARLFHLCRNPQLPAEFD